MSGTAFIISAPSGSGKTTLTNELLKLVPNLRFSISYTTRKPRGSEVNGREYYFIERDAFEAMIRAGEFLEHADVFGNYYGTARCFLDAARADSQDLLLDIDVQGALQVKSRLGDAVSIFILPPSREVLERRLRNRSHAEQVNSEAVIQRRLEAAGKEIENYGNYDYILVNDRLEQSIDELKAIVMAERLKRSGSELPPEASLILEIAERCSLPNARARAQQILASFIAPAVPGGNTR
ncbi:MAG TPA: guanylate kinase [Terriglobales bacterium]|nr:guanylate kinase [Terriglobales bacterium]